MQDMKGILFLCEVQDQKEENLVQVLLKLYALSLSRNKTLTKINKKKPKRREVKL